MRAVFIGFIVTLFFHGIVFAQSDTTFAARNADTSMFIIDVSGEIIQKFTKDVGKGIPHLVIFNLAFEKVPIKLSQNGEVWTNFELQPNTKNLYRCDGIQNMFIIIDPDKPNTVKSKIVRGKKYKIIYDTELKFNDLKEIQ